MGYEETISQITGGVRHTDPSWRRWYEMATANTPEERIKQVFGFSGRVPTRAQYDEVMASVAVPEEPPIEQMAEPVMQLAEPEPPVEEPEETVTPKPVRKRTTKPKPADEESEG